MKNPVKKPSWWEEFTAFAIKGNAMALAVGTIIGAAFSTITLTWNTPQVIRYLVMQEPIKLGQRIKEFKIEYSEDGSSWTELCPNMQTTTVGYKRIIPLNGKTNESYGNGYKAKQLRVTILDSRACPLLSNLNVY